MTPRLITRKKEQFEIQNFLYLTELYHKREEHQLHPDSKNELLNESFLVQPIFIICGLKERKFSKSKT